MKRCAGWLARPVVLVVGFVLSTACPAVAQQERAVLSGIQYLRTHHRSQPTGDSAMVALGMIKAELPANDPDLMACVAKIQARLTTSTYEPEMQGGHDIYEAGVCAMVLANLDADTNRVSIKLIADYLLRKQKANGSWDYVPRDHGDASISQYAVLGLWEAENAGVDVPPSVWDRAASWYMSVQSAAGSWCYHRDEGSPETLSMTAAGVGSLLICQRQLEKYRGNRRGTSSLLKSLVAETTFAEYHPTTTNAQFDAAVRRGIGWISGNFAPTNLAIVGQTPYYMLYGIERIGALADREKLGRVDWYEKGRTFINSTQQGDGSWTGGFGNVDNTVWAILFLTKSTKKTLQRVIVKKLGAGTLLGGRELKGDLTAMTVAGGRVVNRPMNGAVEGMLAVLEDPRANQGDAAVAGLVERYYQEGPEVLRPFKARFRKMLGDRDPGVRRVALWALAHTGDLDVAPTLIESLLDPDDEVMTAAKLGLQLLSRKIDGLGPEAGSTPEERRAAAARWREWYNAIKPLDLEGQDDDSTSPAPAPAAANQAKSKG
ncbi:MAG: HEAT repeat domain-containing protein [Isosphaeraceae bacterium]